MGGVRLALGAAVLGLLLGGLELAQWVQETRGTPLLVGVTSSSPSQIELGGCAGERITRVVIGDPRSPTWQLDGDGSTGQTLEFGEPPQGMTTTRGPGVLPGSSERLSINVVTDRRAVSTGVWLPVRVDGVASGRASFDGVAAFRAAAVDASPCSATPWWHRPPAWLGPALLALAMLAAVFGMTFRRPDTARSEADDEAGAA